MNILEIDNLTVSFNNQQVIKGVSFRVKQGECVGIVGESGSGKSITSLSIMKLLPKNAVVESGEVIYQSDDKVDLLNLEEKDLYNIRGKNVSMIFQEPMTSLNPSMRCGEQVLEIILNHTKKSKAEAKSQVVELFEEVKLPNPERIFDSYPHEVSGGQKQRVMIAIAIALKPKILIADEPTTALDVTVQKSILGLLNEIRQNHNISIIFISHDLGVISKIADRVLVMYKGEIVEAGATTDVLNNPQNKYTKALMACRPTADMKGKVLPTLADFNRGQKDGVVIPEQIYNDVLLEVQDISKDYAVKRNVFGKVVKKHKAVQGISFKLYKGETLGLVGESGCGKTTLGRTLVRLLESTSGNIIYQNKKINEISQRDLKNFRRKVQFVFQDPYSSLNPKKTIGDLLLEPLKVHKIGNSKTVRRQIVFDYLERVKLPKESFYKYPHEFSGGQRQRIVIARALILNPEFVICDESVSALDVSVQAEILNLLNELKKEFGLTYIFISHDLSVVRYMSDRIMVMKNGQLEEINKADEIYFSPASNYTKSLINSIPEI